MLSFCKKGVALSFVAVAFLVAGLLGNKVSAAGLTDGLTINPDYLKYMSDVKAGEGSKWKLIPNKYLPVDRTVFNEGKGGGGVPTEYNLVEANYGTMLKNQGRNGDCWAYATSTAMESYMKKTQGVDIEFSPKQLDYMLMSTTRYGKYLEDKLEIPHELGKGGNFAQSIIGLRSKYLPDKEADFYARMQKNDPELKDFSSFQEYTDITSIAFFAFGDDYGAYNKEMAEEQIFGDEAKYIVNGMKLLYGADKDTIEEVKEAVYKNGAVYVGTFAPGSEGTESCWDEESKTIIDKGFSKCGEENGHAMSIIGWDDEHTYKDPVTGEEKTGAFILQNSYGKKTLFDDYSVTAESLAKYAYEQRYNKPIEDFTEGELEEYTNAVTELSVAMDSYKENDGPNEYPYLGYDASDGINFGFITSMTENDYLDIYDVTTAEVKLSEEKINFEMSTDDKQAIYEVGRDLLAGLSKPVEVAVNIDVDGDEVADSTESLKFAVGEAGRKVVKLASPVAVSGDFNVTLSSETIGFEEGDDLYLSPIVYTKEYVEEEEEEEIAVPNTGMFTGDNHGLVMVIPFVLALGSVGMVLAYNLKNRMSNAKKIRFTKK